MAVSTSALLGQTHTLALYCRQINDALSMIVCYVTTQNPQNPHTT